MTNTTVSAKGDFAYTNTGDAHLEFFSKAGSLRRKKGNSFHASHDTVDILDLFRGSWYCDDETAMRLAFWVRDCRRDGENRSGSGNRSGFRKIITWVAEKHPEWVIANLRFIPETGRWDDLKSLVGTECETEAIEYWVDSILGGNKLAAKWAPRAKRDKDLFNKMRKVAEMAPADWRKLLAKNTQVVETAMCQHDWNDINYNHVPSVAMARSRNAFNRHDSVRFEGWASGLASGETKVNASVLFPHDIITAMKAELRLGNWGYRAPYQTSDLADGQFAALPNYMEGTNERVMPICDFSGSMGSCVAGNVTAMDISMGLGLYCSDRVGEDNPFYRKFIPFSTTSKLVDWRDDRFSIAVQKHNDGWCGSTNIQAALDQILDAAKLFNATDEQIPTTLLILSDMQFDCACRHDKNAVEVALEKWEAAGYSKPKIVYWNLVGYGSSPATKDTSNVGMVSGFSPSVLTAILSGDEFTPMAIMRRAIAKYSYVVVPE